MFHLTSLLLGLLTINFALAANTDNDHSHCIRYIASMPEISKYLKINADGKLNASEVFKVANRSGATIKIGTLDKYGNSNDVISGKEGSYDFKIKLVRKKNLLNSIKYKLVKYEENQINANSSCKSCPFEKKKIITLLSFDYPNKKCIPYEKASKIVTYKQNKKSYFTTDYNLKLCHKIRQFHLKNINQALNKFSKKNDLSFKKIFSKFKKIRWKIIDPVSLKSRTLQAQNILIGNTHSKNKISFTELAQHVFQECLKDESLRDSLLDEKVW